MIESCAALVAAYGAVAYAVPWMPAPDVVARTDDPPPCATMRGTNACRQCSKPSTLVSTAVRQTSRFGSRSRSALGAPALKNATSTRPKRSNATSGEVRHVAGRSRCRWVRRRPSSPPALSSSTARWSRSARRDTSTSCIPRSANAVAVARPIPVEPTGDHRDLPLEPHDQAVGWSTLTEVRFSAVQSNVPGFFGNTRTHFSSLICITR